MTTVAQPAAALTPGSCRNTPWRQGHVLTSAAVEALSLDHNHKYLVISHDCDLAQEKDAEPQVELIAASLVDEANANFRLGENPRVLHLSFLATGQGSAPVLQLRAVDKQCVDKGALFATNPDAAFQLEEQPCRLLQSWLACRYRRHALPNELNDRLRPAYSKLKEAAKKKNDGVIATYIHYHPTGEVLATEPYEVKFVVVYENKAVLGAENAQALCNKLTTALEKADGIDFCGAISRSETAFTMADQRAMWEWRLEFLSFRGDVVGSTTERL